MIYPAHKIEEHIKINELYTLFSRHYEKDFVFPGEVHDFWECVYVLDGNISASGDGRVYNLCPGDIICHKPMELHKFSIESEGGARLLIFSFSAEGKATEHLKNKMFHMSESEKEVVSSLLKYADSKVNSKEASEHSFSDYLKVSNPPAAYLQIISTYIQRLLLSLGEEGEIVSTSDSPEAVIFSCAISYMKGLVTENPSVYQVAKYCNISLSGLKRIFSKYAGMGVHKYFLMLKIQTAAYLLGSGMNVTDVAESLGFSDQGYFSRSFLRETGILPSKFKKIK